MIQQPSAIAKGDKKIRMLVAGYPGIGKSTLGLSAPNPLHIDVDRGIDRVPAHYRKPFIQPATYEEVLEDLLPEKIADYDTLVFDTGGQLIKLMAPWAIRKNIKNGQKDGSLSLKGYGEIGREFERLMNYCFYELNKNIVVLFHAKEEKEGDYTRLRLMVEGQTKDNVWQPMDLGGFMEMSGNDRTIGFSNCEKYFAKGTHGITGNLRIPKLENGAANDFLTRLFRTINENIVREAQEVEQVRQRYNEVMEAGQEIISSIQSPEDATAAVKQIGEIEHALTSEKELQNIFVLKTRELGFRYNKAKGVYECIEETEAAS